MGLESEEKEAKKNRPSAFKEHRKRKVKHVDQQRPTADEKPSGVRALKPPVWGLVGALALVLFVSFGLVLEGITLPQAVGKAGKDVNMVVTDFKKKVKKAKDKAEGHDQELYGDNTWRTVAMNAEYYFDVDAAWTDVVLAMIQVESNGDIYIDDQGDIMQAAEGDGNRYLYNGVPEKGVEAGTPEASVYAGVFELRECISSYRKHLGSNPNPKDEDDVGMVAQGYNYGHEGWFIYCANNGVTSWSLDASTDYQGQIGGIGTANHGAKVQQAWEEIRANKGK